MSAFTRYRACLPRSSIITAVRHESCSIRSGKVSSCTSNMFPMQAGSSLRTSVALRHPCSMSLGWLQRRGQCGASATHGSILSLSGSSCPSHVLFTCVSRHWLASRRTAWLLTSLVWLSMPWPIGDSTPVPCRARLSFGCFSRIHFSIHQRLSIVKTCASPLSASHVFT